jgi:rubrerythrin
MQAEALAHATHIVFAAHARQSGWEELALIFERVAAEELYDHFAKEAELIELAGTDLDNIRASIESEHYEAKAVYGEYAAKAAAAGDSAAAALFEAIRDDKRRHEEAFRRALAQAAPELARG